VLYAGGLTAAYGVDRMVAAVRALGRDDVRLSCFGRGELVDWVAAVAADDPRIDAPQFTSREDVLSEYQRATLLIQPRPVDQDFVRFSFPSKLLEYLASGTPVVSTRLPSIPADYEEQVYWADDDSVEGLSRTLERVLATPWHERQLRAARARDFIWTTRGYEAQGRRMRDFIARFAGRA
jgi:glycosyltransferase involved in cell wall biosynthesis